MPHGCAGRHTPEHQMARPAIADRATRDQLVERLQPSRRGAAGLITIAEDSYLKAHERLRTV